MPKPAHHHAALAAAAQAIYADEAGDISLAMTMLQAKLHPIVGRIDDFACSAAYFAGQTVAAVDDSKKTMTRLQQETLHVATAMNQMAVAVREVARSTVRAASAAQKVDEEAGNIREMIAHLQEGSREASDAMRQDEAQAKISVQQASLAAMAWNKITQSVQIAIAADATAAHRKMAVR